MTHRDDLQAFLQGRRNRLGGPEIVFVTNDDLGESHLPAWWFEVNELDGQIAVERALAEWESSVGPFLPDLMSYLRQNGNDVFIVQVLAAGATQSIAQNFLLYSMKYGDSSTTFTTRVGSPAADATHLPPYWSSLPAELRDFYLQVHNGFTDLGGAGLAAVQDFRPVSDYGHADEYELRPRANIDAGAEATVLPDIHRLVELASDGAGGALCIDSAHADGFAWDLYEGRLTEKPLWATLDEMLLPPE